MMSFWLSRILRHRVVLSWLVIVSLQGCEVPPEVRVAPTSPPTFTFSSQTVVDMLLVHHLKRDNPNEGILLDELLEDKPNTSWMVEGKHDNRIPITYGSVPAGMKETVPAKPLVEGEYYLVLVGSLVGARFVIRDGTPQPIR